MQNRVSQFVSLRVAALVPRDVAHLLERYFVDIVALQKVPPRSNNGRVDWLELACAAGLPVLLDRAAKKALLPLVEAIERWLAARGYDADGYPGNSPASSRRRKSASEIASTGAVAPTPAQLRAPNLRRGRPARTVQEHPVPILRATDDPPEFALALDFQMRRHGDTCWTLFRALREAGEALDRKTLTTWVSGTKVPRTAVDLPRRIGEVSLDLKGNRDGEAAAPVHGGF